MTLPPWCHDSRMLRSCGQGLDPKSAQTVCAQSLGQKSGKELAESLLLRQLCPPWAAIVEALAGNFHWVSTPWSAAPKSRWNCDGMATKLGDIFARRLPTIVRSFRCLTKKATISPCGRNGEIIPEPQQISATMTQVVLKGASLSFIIPRVWWNLLYYSHLHNSCFCYQTEACVPGPCMKVRKRGGERGSRRKNNSGRDRSSEWQVH